MKIPKLGDIDYIGQSEYQLSLIFLFKKNIINYFIINVKIKKNFH